MWRTAPVSVFHCQVESGIAATFASTSALSTGTISSLPPRSLATPHADVPEASTAPVYPVVTFPPVYRKKPPLLRATNGFGLLQKTSPGVEPSPNTMHPLY